MGPGKEQPGFLQLLCGHFCGELVAGRIGLGGILEDPALPLSFCTLCPGFLANRRIPCPQLGCNLQAECNLPMLFSIVLSPQTATWTGSLKDASEETVFTQASLPLLPTMHVNPQALGRAFVSFMCLSEMPEGKWKRKNNGNCGTKD